MRGYETHGLTSWFAGHHTFALSRGHKWVVAKWFSCCFFYWIARLYQQWAQLHLCTAVHRYIDTAGSCRSWRKCLTFWEHDITLISLVFFYFVSDIFRSVWRWIKDGVGSNGPLSETRHLDEEDGPELGPGRRLAQRPVARQVRPLDGEDGVGDAHQQHARRKPQEARGGEQQEGCETGARKTSANDLGNGTDKIYKCSVFYMLDLHSFPFSFFSYNSVSMTLSWTCPLTP